MDELAASYKTPMTKRQQLKWKRMAAGQWFLRWDNALEQIGTGSQDHRHLSVRRRLPPMAKAKQNVCLHRQ
jgi:hypothetical protein